MNLRLICKNLGYVLLLEAGCMVPPLLVALFYRQGDSPSFFISILIAAAVGFAMSRAKPAERHLYARDGFAIVALGWLLVSAFGAVPFVLSGAIPAPVDAFFESASGFTTTGASILPQVEGLPNGVLFWRSFTHWMGGMGVLILMLALMPYGSNTLSILKAECPGPSPEKFVPKMKQVATILYLIYGALTALEIVFLLAGGMPVFDSFIHAFGTAGTGGFSNKNLSVAAYHSVYLEMVIAVFMVLFGVNFTLYYFLLKKNFRAVLRDEELRFYLSAVAVSILLITLNLCREASYSAADALRYSSFQVSSIITTTGFSSIDFAKWPVFSQAILVLLMFLGPSSGSTGGAIKAVRIVVLFKIARREIAKIIHPNSVYTVRINRRAVPETTLSGILAFFFLYITAFTVSVLVVSADGKDLVSSFSAVAATLGNIGPGLGIVGPLGNFGSFSVLSKLVFSFCMILGRLEILPVLLILAPASWRRVNL